MCHYRFDTMRRGIPSHRIETVMRRGVDVRTRHFDATGREGIDPLRNPSSRLKHLLPVPPWGEFKTEMRLLRPRSEVV